MKYFWILLCIALLPRLTAGQCYSSQKRPAWVDGYFKENPNSYVEVATANGYSEEDARNKAAQIIMERRNLATGQRVNVQVQNGNFVVTGNGEFTVKARVLGEYREHCGPGDYRVSLLVQTAKNPTFDFEKVNVTDEYSFSPRAFVPGMAQLYRGSTGKGIFFIAAEAAMITGAVYCEMQRSDNMRKSQETGSMFVMKEYRNRADDWALSRNVAIGAAVGVYVWNVLDAALTRGKIHYALIPDNVHLTTSKYNDMCYYGVAFNF